MLLQRYTSQHRCRMREIVCVVALLLTTSLAQQSNNDVQRHWTYNAKAPLEIKQSGVERRGDVQIQDLSYATEVGNRSSSDADK